MGNKKSAPKQSNENKEVQSNEFADDYWCNLDNFNDDAQTKLKNINMPPLPMDGIDWDSIAAGSISQDTIFHKITSLLFEESLTMVQLLYLKGLIMFLDPILIETKYRQFSETDKIGYNLIDLCIVFLPNQHQKSVLFLSNLKKLSLSAFHRFLCDECPIFKQMHIIDDIALVICDYVSQISTVFECKYAVTDSNEYTYPKSFHHGPYYCFVKSIFICYDFISIEYDEHGDVNDAGPIQAPKYSNINCEAFRETAAFQSDFEYDLDKRCQGRLIYACTFEEYKDHIKGLYFQFGSSGYSNVTLFEKSNVQQNRVLDEVLKCFLDVL